MASAEITKLEDFQKKIVKEIGKEKRVIAKEELMPESLAMFNENILPKMEDAIFAGAGKAKIDEMHSTWNKMVKDYIFCYKLWIMVPINQHQVLQKFQILRMLLIYIRTGLLGHGLRLEERKQASLLFTILIKYLDLRYSAGFYPT